MNMGRERFRLHLAVARAEDDELDRGAHRTERLGERGGRHEPRTTIRSLEDQTLTSVAVVRTGDTADIARWRGAVILGSGTTATATAEVDHRRLELAQLPEQIERFSRPPCHELEAISVAAPLELDLDRPRLSV
jgi:hypothetical protein